MSLRPLNQQTAKSQLRALLTFTKDRSRYLLTFTKDKYHQFSSLVASQSVMSLRPLNQQTAKSQFLSLLTFTKERSHPYSLTLTKGKYFPFSPVRANLETDDFSIGYVIATPEPTDSQVSLSNPTKTMFSSRTRLEIRTEVKTKERIFIKFQKDGVHGSTHTMTYRRTL